jgi:DNA-directed RNA polymerase specialized sigma24 family protein
MNSQISDITQADPENFRHLSVREYGILMLREVDDWTFVQIAKAYDRSPAAVRRTHAKAKRIAIWGKKK